MQDNYASPSEPTETMAFSLYGLTGYEVQYWTGSTWLTVPGGSVSGNNKVWRKFTFSPLTTTKIRVLTNASGDGYSRITEVEAWQAASGGSSGAEISWMVADQLGTPRMIADKTGTLAGITRHDYLPFGEELTAGTGGRSASQGYVVDDVRQKFTQKERDVETGLDYFGARYYSSTQGRFISPDSVGGKIVYPQSLNLYTYVRNNPLKFIDPTGHQEEEPRLSPEELKKIHDEAAAENGLAVIDHSEPKYVPTTSQLFTDWWQVLSGKLPYGSYARNYGEYLKKGHD